MLRTNEEYIKKKKRVMKCGHTKKVRERPETANQRKRKTDTSTGLEGPKVLENRSSFTAEALAVFGIITTFLNFYFPPHLQAMAHEIPAWNAELVG